MDFVRYNVYIKDMVCINVLGSIVQSQLPTYCTWFVLIDIKECSVCINCTLDFMFKLEESFQYGTDSIYKAPLYTRVNLTGVIPDIIHHHRTYQKQIQITSMVPLASTHFLYLIWMTSSVSSKEPYHCQ